MLTFAGEMLNLVLGVPGARTLERPDGSSGLLAFVLEIGVVLPSRSTPPRGGRNPSPSTLVLCDHGRHGARRRGR